MKFVLAKNRLLLEHLHGDNAHLRGLTLQLPCLER